MEQQPPPLTPEEVAHLSAKEYAHLGQPQTVKVLGILHLVFGAIGTLMIIWTLYVTFVGNPFLAFAGKSPEMLMQQKLEKEMMGVTLMSTALYALITVIILIAGVLLLKGRRSALKYSNSYAWLSIASKFINLVVYFLYVAPMSQEMMRASASSAGMASTSMEIFMTGTMVGVFVLGLIYPILTLVLLNRPVIKTWLANQPS